MIIKPHVYERYVERIIGIMDKQEQKQYIAVNQDILQDKIYKMFEFSKFVWQGVVSKKNNTTAKFFISDNVIMVVDISLSNLLTLYKVDFGFPEHINRQTLKGLLAELETLNATFEVANVENTKFIGHKEIDVENLENEIKSLQLQLDMKKAQKEFMVNEIKNKRSESDYIRKEIDKYAFMICNSLELKKDFVE